MAVKSWTKLEEILDVNKLTKTEKLWTQGLNVQLMEIPAQPSVPPINSQNYVKMNNILIPQVTSLLRKAFLKLWQNSSDEIWKNSPEQATAFITGTGKRAWATCSRRQKVLLETGNVNLWDLKLVINILRKTELGLDAIEKENLTDLGSFVYHFNHNNHAALSNWEFNNISKLIDGATEVFDKYTNNITLDPVDSRNVIKAKELKKKGNDYYVVYNKDELKNRLKAIKYYTEAINLTGLPNELLGTLYSNRATVYSYKAPNLRFDEEKHILGLEDAKRAATLRPGWLRPYTRLGDIYQALQKYHKAARWHGIATQMDPTDYRSMGFREWCLTKEVRTKIPQVDYPVHFYQTEEEFSKLLKDKLVLNVDEAHSSGKENDFTRKLMRQHSKMLEGEVEKMVHNAHCHMIGYKGRKINYKKAYKLYSKAADQGNADALYHLGMMYRDGTVVDKDCKKAVEILKLAAESGQNESADAEYHLGYIYEKGMGVCQDLEEAVMWYERANINDNNYATNTLASLYTDGKGVEQSIERAVQYWKLAAKRSSPFGMQRLASYYLNYEGDGVKALQWHRLAFEGGDLWARDCTNEFVAKCEMAKARFNELEQQIKTWERKSGSTADGCTVKERIRRFQEKHIPGFKDFVENLRNYEEEEVETEKKKNFDKVMLKAYAEKGSITAGKILEAIAHYETAEELLKIDATGNAEKIIHEIAETIRRNEDVIHQNPEVYMQSNEIANKLRDQHDDEISEFNRDLNTVYLLVLGNVHPRAILFLEELMKNYPEDKWFYTAFCYILQNQNRHQEAIELAEKALKIFQNDCEFLYSKAANLYLSGFKNEKRVIDAYKKFLAVAPSDHPNVPKVYYGLATIALSCQDISEVTEYYFKGLQAEKNQLPCYLPYIWEQKTCLEAIPCIKAYKDIFDAPLEGKEEKKQMPKKPKIKVEKGKSEEEQLFIRLTDPCRVALIVEHRQNIQRGVDNFLQYATTSALEPNVAKQYAPGQLADVKFITLDQVNPYKGQVYDGCALSCTLIEDPFLRLGNNINLVIEDDNRDVEQVLIYNVAASEVLKKFTYGCKIVILNPLIKLDADGKQMIRVDDVESIIFENNGDKSRCRFCGKTESIFFCSKCHVAAYCSRKCQKKDYKVMKHEYICAN